MKGGFPDIWTEEFVNVHNCSIASSVVILQANQLVDDWLMRAEQLVTSLPLALQSVTAGLVESVKKTTLEKNQCRIA